MQRASVIGGGAFGTAMACVLSSKFASVNVWLRKEDNPEAIESSRENKDFMPGYRLPDGVHFTSDVSAAVDASELVLLAIPTQFLRSFLAVNRSTFPVGVPIVTCAKGIELSSLQFPYSILRDELPGKYGRFLVALSGPSFAKEIMEKQPTAVTVAGEKDATLVVQKLLSSKSYNFRVYTSEDAIGCEVAGAVKNVLAIASGCASGLGYGANTRALLICRGLAEISRLVHRLGGDGSALSGLAGVGDLLLTCSSELSRNFSVGKQLAEGHKIDQILASSHAVAEGVVTAKALFKLIESLKLDMPICTEVYKVIYEGRQVADAIETLSNRPLGGE